MTWTRPDDLRAQVRRLWDNGKLLASVVTGESLFPLRLTLRSPTAPEVAAEFDSVRKWIGALQGISGVRVEMRERSHRVHGSNLFPVEVWVDSVEDAVALIGKRSDTRRFKDLIEQTRERQPLLLPWVAKKPLKVLELEAVWQRLLAVVDWTQANPRSGIYLRQVDIEGVHSKFIEAHRSVLQELLDVVLPSRDIDESASGVGQFARRYGFRDKPVLIRFRILDASCQMLSCGGIQDITLDDASFAALDVRVSKVIIVENEINFLSIPAMTDTLAIFGSGYGFDGIKKAAWLGARDVYYWGDIDTHGFAILDQLRSVLPLVKSFLMDRATLMGHASHWTIEPQPHHRDLPRLNNEECLLFDDLRSNRLGQSIRLEQERIGFRWVNESLQRIVIAK